MPLAVLTLTSELIAWPMLASYGVVCILNSLIAAVGGANAYRFRPALPSANVLGTPSI